MNLHAPKGIDVENWFIECYRKHKGHPLKILIGLYKGNYNKFFLAVLFFFIIVIYFFTHFYCRKEHHDI